MSTRGDVEDERVKSTRGWREVERERQLFFHSLLPLSLSVAPQPLFHAAVSIIFLLSSHSLAVAVGKAALPRSTRLFLSKKVVSSRRSSETRLFFS